MGDSDTQLYLLIGSVCLNGILVIKEFVHRIRTSECCGAKIAFITRRSSETNMKTNTPDENV